MLDFTCAKVNEAVGVDDCAVGSFCIDTDSKPSRCVDLD